MKAIDMVTIWHDIQDPVYYLLRYGPEEHPGLFAKLAKTTTAKLLVHRELDSEFAYGGRDGSGGAFVVMSEDAGILFILKYAELIKSTITHAEMIRGMLRLSQMFVKPLSMMQFLCDLKVAGQSEEYDIIIGHTGDTAGIPEHYLPFLFGVDKLLNKIAERE